MEPQAGLNNLDFVVLGVLLLSGVLALFRGFVREVLSLISWTVAYFAAVKYHYLAEPWVHHHIKNEMASALAAGVGVFLIVLIICAIISNIIAGLVKGKALGAIDRSLGFAFGLLRGGLVVCIVYMAVSAMMWPEADKPLEQQPKDAMQPPDWVKEAKTRPWMARGAVVLRNFIPEEDIKAATAEFDKKFRKEYDEQKANAQKAVEQKALDDLSTPVPAGSKDKPAPAYSDTSRSSLNQLINQKSN